MVAKKLLAEDMKEAGDNIDLNSYHSFSHIDGTPPPVLQCEIIKNRKNS